MTSAANIMEEEEYEEENAGSPSKGKKIVYPFGTPTHNCTPYSKFAHIGDASTIRFAAQLASSTESSFEPVEVVEKRPKRTSSPKRAASKTNAPSSPSENVAEAIPDTEGLEPCTKIACQLVLRAIADIQYKNEVERDEIEDEYERLLQELAQSEQEIAAADAKMVLLNDMGSSLEQRHGQLMEKVTTLMTAKDAQDSERSDINNRVSNVSLSIKISTSIFFIASSIC